MSLKDIKDGWFNYIRNSISARGLDPDFKNEVQLRSEICADCPELRVTGFGKNYVRGKCNQCGCTYPAMIFAPKKKCPLSKWGKYEP